MGKVTRSAAVERFGNLELPLGSGIHRYVGVRKVRNGQFQGYTPKKTHTTKACNSAHEAAVLRAQKKFNVQLFGEATKRKRSVARKSRWEGKPLSCPLPSHRLSSHDSCGSTLAEPQVLSAAKKLKVDETNATEVSLPPIRLQALRITREQAALLCACGRPLVRAVLMA